VTPSPPIRPKKALGQHFLRDPNLIRKIVAALEPAPGDLVLEYGAGTGALTRPLAASGADLVAVEVDPDLLARLREAEELGAVAWRSEGLEALPPDRVADERGVGRLKLVGNLP
jgi:16S rRNA (adenine1518-N6/adenine1519-N6)-dimethyltransferase